MKIRIAHRKAIAVLEADVTLRKGRRRQQLLTEIDNLLTRINILLQFSGTGRRQRDRLNRMTESLTPILAKAGTCRSWRLLAVAKEFAELQQRMTGTLDTISSHAYPDAPTRSPADQAQAMVDAYSLRMPERRPDPLHERFRYAAAPRSRRSR